MHTLPCVRARNVIHKQAGRLRLACEVLAGALPHTSCALMPLLLLLHVQQQHAWGLNVVAPCTCKAGQSGAVNHPATHGWCDTQQRWFVKHQRASRSVVSRLSVAEREAGRAPLKQCEGLACHQLQ